MMTRYVYAALTKVLEIFYSDSAPGSGKRVYMLHELSTNRTETAKFTSNISAFERFLDAEMEIHPARTVEDIIRPEVTGGFAITFDDVSESVYSLAYPILKMRNMPFTIFVAANYVDRPGYLTRDELLELSNDPLCTVGSHTNNHSMLRNSKTLREEIAESKNIIEKIIQKKICFFAYPYGSVFACSFKSVRVAAKSGYQAAFSTIHGYITKRSLKMRYFLPRINADYHVKKYAEENV